MTKQPLDIKSLDDIYGAETVNELLELSLGESEKLVGLLSQGVSQRDTQAVVREAHQLKGMSAAITFNEMTELGANLGAAVKAANWEESETIMAAIEACYQQYVEYLKVVLPQRR